MLREMMPGLYTTRITIGPEFSRVKAAERLVDGEEYLELVGMKVYAMA